MVLSCSLTPASLYLISCSSVRCFVYRSLACVSFSADLCFVDCVVVSMSHSLLYFFFSSRRRHTRCLSDWSSDVCSSDLGAIRQHRAPFDAGAGPRTEERIFPHFRSHTFWLQPALLERRQPAEVHHKKSGDRKSVV